MLGVAQAVVLGAAGCEPRPATYAQRVKGKHPAWYLTLSDGQGMVAVAEVGPDGTYVNAAQLGVDPLALEDDFGRSVGLNGESVSPSHITAPSPIVGPDLTIDLIAQFDTLAPAKQILITRAGGADGTFGVEVLQDGRARAYSHHDGTVSEILGSPGDVQQGTVHKITYQRQSGASPSQRMLVDGIEVAADPILRSWPTVPPGTVYVGAWSNGAAAFDGLIAHVAGWSRYLPQGEINDLVRLLDSVAWAEDIDAGTILPNDSKTISVRSGGWHGKTPLTATAGNGSLVTTTESGEEITIKAGATEGADTFTYWLKDANNNTSPTRAVSVSVTGVASGNEHDALVMAAPGQISNADLQAADTYYWSSEINDSIRNGWNGQIEANRWNFDNSHPPATTNLNTKTFISHNQHFHTAVIEPAPQFSDEVLVTPSMSQAGVLRMTRRNKQGWNHQGSAIRNFRKHACTLRLRNNHPAYIRTASNRWDTLIYNQTYETGCTFWLGGNPSTRFYQNGGEGGACAIMQVHSNEAPCIYFQVGSNGQCGGFTREQPGNDSLYRTNITQFPLTTGYDDIHVFRYRFRLGTGGFFTVWYNGEQKYNINRNFSGFTNPFQNECFIYANPWPIDSNNGRSPSKSGGSTAEPTIYADRVWRKAV